MLALLFFASCEKGVIIDKNIKIENSIWDYEKPLVFTTQILDTIHGHNVYINLRNAGVYPFSNIFLFLNTRFPNGQLERDTIEIMLANAQGKWLGKGLGDIWDNRILFKHNVRFPQSGEYRFEFTHAMRMNPLPGIMDGGIRIEKVEKE
jgi:gliding motility-associated lipoprotein GldH